MTAAPKPTPAIARRKTRVNALMTCKCSGGSAAWSLRLSLGLEHGGGERLTRGLVRPDHELEGREVALAGVERGSEQRLALPARGFDPAGEHQRVAIHDEAVLGPEVEMPDPHLLV